MKKTTETRPWGNYTILDENNHFKVKRIVVKPGQRLSYQFHYKREENWTIVEGEATIILDDNQLTVKVGQSIFIPIRAKHRIINKKETNLVFIEVQTGTYFGEDDIVRIQDDYNRE